MNTPTIRNESEILDLVARSIESDAGGSAFPGMTYEEGVRAALAWILDEVEDPLAD